MSAGLFSLRLMLMIRSTAPPHSTRPAQARPASSAIGAAVFAPTDQFEGRHLGPSLEDEKVMLQAIGAFFLCGGCMKGGCGSFLSGPP